MGRTLSPNSALLRQPRTADLYGVDLWRLGVARPRLIATLGANTTEDLWQIAVECDRTSNGVSRIDAFSEDGEIRERLVRVGASWLHTRPEVEAE